MRQAYPRGYNSTNREFMPVSWPASASGQELGHNGLRVTAGTAVVGQFGQHHAHQAGAGRRGDRPPGSHRESHRVGAVIDFLCGKYPMGYIPEVGQLIPQRVPCS